MQSDGQMLAPSSRDHRKKSVTFEEEKSPLQPNPGIAPQSFSSNTSMLVAKQPNTSRSRRLSLTSKKGETSSSGTQMEGNNIQHGQGTKQVSRKVSQEAKLISDMHSFRPAKRPVNAVELTSIATRLPNVAQMRPPEEIKIQREAIKLPEQPKKTVSGSEKTNSWDKIDFKSQLEMDMFEMASLMTGRPFKKVDQIMEVAGLTSPDLRFDVGNYRPKILRRRSSASLYSNCEVMDVLAGLQKQKQQRQQDAMNQELKDIKKRVQKSLEDVDMADDPDKDPGVFQPVAFLPMYDTRAAWEKMQERTYILDRVDSFEEKAVTKKQFLTEVNFWFQDNLNLASDLATPEELNEIVREAAEWHDLICSSLEEFIATGDKVVEKGRMYLEETGKIIEERQAQMDKRSKRERIIIYDEKVLLAEPAKWESSATMIMSVFEDSHKMMKNVVLKNALKLGQKQFEYMMLASDMRSNELDDKRKMCMELQGKLHSAKVQTDRVNREVEEQKKKVAQMGQEMEATNKALLRNQEMQSKVVELNAKIRSLEEQLMQANRTPTPPLTPPPPPEPEKIYVKVVDSSTELRLREVEAELAKARAEVEDLMLKLEEVTDQLQSEQNRSRQLESRTVELEPPAPIFIHAPAPVPISPAPHVPEAQAVPDKDAHFYKTLMAGMKKDFEAELEKVKGHIHMEKSRGEAGIRKMENLHKDQLNSIQRDTLRILRAIMHFRDHMLTCLEKENLVDQAQALHALGDLSKDKITQDARDVLVAVVGVVVDYLHSLEGILSNSFLALKVLMRYQVERQVEQEVQLRLARERQECTVKEVKKKDRMLKTKRKDISGLAKMLKKAKKKLMKAKQDIQTYPSDKHYKDLLERYNNMMKMYQKMHREMKSLQSDFHVTMQKKLDEKETLVITQIKMQMKQQHVLNEEHLKLSIIDQRENLCLLSRAYDDNKISRDLYAMAKSMIQKTMEIPQQKLRNLFEQYITFRAIQESKQRVAKVLQEEEDLAVDTRNEMQLYLADMQGRFNSSMKDWRNKMKQLESEKSEMNQRIYKLFNEVLLETGILLVHPLLKDKDRETIFTNAATQVSRKQLHALLLKRQHRGIKLQDEFLRLPSVLHGCAIPSYCGPQRLWSQPSEESKLAPSVVSPHMLAYEVNKPKINAVRVLGRNRKRYHMGRTASFHISDQNYVQFIRDLNVPHYSQDHPPEVPAVH